MRLINRFVIAGAVAAIACGPASRARSLFPVRLGRSRRRPLLPPADDRLERRIGLLRRSAHDRRGDPRGGGEFPRLPRAAVAAGRAPRRRAQRLFALTAPLTPDLRIMDLLDAQPEFTKSFWDYLDLLVTDARIEKGRALLARYRATFDAVERAYGVDRHIIAAIWGVETDYGAQVGDRPVIRSTATLACIGRRQRYFREEFLSALEILPRGDVRANRLVGSWAGAFGPTQFMPTAFKRYAVDFDRDGRRDVVNSVPDIIASTANNLKNDGWVGGQTGATKWWCRRTSISCSPTMRARWRSANGSARGSCVRARAVPASGRARLPAGAGRRPGAGLPDAANFRVIMRYNPAEAYALAIGHLADRLRGGAPFVQKLAALRAGAVARRAAGIATIAGAARLRCRRAGRPSRRPDAGGDPRFPGPDRAGSRRLCLGGDARPAARALKLIIRPPSS